MMGCCAIAMAQSNNLCQSGQRITASRKVERFERFSGL